MVRRFVPEFAGCPVGPASPSVTNVPARSGRFLPPVVGGAPRRASGRPARTAAGALAALLALACLLAGVTSASAQTSVLVSNIGQDAITPGTRSITAQAFTTGANSAGYGLTSVEVGFLVNLTSNNGFLVRIVPNSTAGLPDESDATRIITLTNPASITANAANTFTAPADTTLAASTTYYVVISGSNGTEGPAFTLGNTDSDSEDSGEAEGWSIENNRRWRSSSTDSWSTADTSLRIRVNGATIDDTELSGLALADGATNVALSPAFAPATTSYTARVVNSVTSLTVAYTSNFDGASVDILDASNMEIDDADGNMVGHQVNLTVGANIIKVKVTAEDGATSRTYTVTVNRAPASASTDTTLSGLALADGTTNVALSPPFVSTTTSYAASVAGSVSAVTVTPTPRDDGAGYELFDASNTLLTDADSATPGDQVSLAEGANTIQVRVTAQDNTATQTYTVTVTRLEIPFTAAFDTIPETHDGSSQVRVQIQFNRALGTFRHLRDGVDVDGGTLANQGRVSGGTNLWFISVRPNGAGDVTIILSAPTACNDDSDICSGDTPPRALAEELTGTIRGPASTPQVTLVLTPAMITESDDTATSGDQHVALVTATVEPASASAFTVSVAATPVAPAVAGDYELSGNTTLNFAANATDSTGTVTLTALDNAIDAPDKTVTVTATVSATGVTAPADVTLTILDDDDTTAPALDTATVDGATLVLTYGEALDTASVPAATAYTVSVGGTDVSLAGASPVAVSGMAVTLTLAAAVASTDVVTVTYAAPTANPVQDAAENAALALTNRAVINDTPDTTPPALVTAQFSGSSVVLTYNEALDGSSLPAASAFMVTAAGASVSLVTLGITGRKVNLNLAVSVSAGQAVSVSYSPPSSNPVQDTSGNPAGALTNQAVTYSTDAAFLVLHTGDVSVTEGDSGTTSMLFPLTLSRADTEAVTVRCLVTSTTGTFGTDYRLPGDPYVTFAAGETSASCTVLVLGDTTDEEDETIVMSVFTTNSFVDTTDNSATGTILDDDDPPTVSIADVSAPEGDALTFAATLSAASGKEVTVDWAAASESGDTATADDFTAVSDTLTFARGETSKTFTVSTTEDTDAESDETFTVTLSNSVNATPNPDSATGTILDNDVPLTLSVTPATVAEGESAEITIGTATTFANGREVALGLSFDPEAQGNVNQTIALTNSQGVALTEPFSLTLPAGQSSVSARLTVSDDTVSDNRTATITATADAPQIASVELLITDDDVVIVGVKDERLTVREDRAQRTVELTLAVSDPTGCPVEYIFGGLLNTTFDEFAGIQQTDVVSPLVNVRLLFAPCVPESSVDVRLVNNRLITGDVEVTATATAVTPIDSDHIKFEGPSMTAIVIQDDELDEVRPVFSDPDGNPLDTLSIAPGDTAMLQLALDVPDQVVTANPDVDVEIGLAFTGISGVTVSPSSVTLDSLSASAPVTLSMPDTVDAASGELNATAVAIIDADTRATFTNPTALAVAATPTLSIADASGPEADGVEFTVTLSPASADTVTVTWTAIASDEYRDTAEAGDLTGTPTGSLSFTAGEASKTFTVTTTDDAVDEENETFTVILSNPVGAPLSTEAAFATGTIEDDDDPPTLTISAPSVMEGDSGTTPMTFIFTLSAASEKMVSMHGTTTDAGYAGGGDSHGYFDFHHREDVDVDFAPGTTSVDFDVEIIGDTYDENDETVGLFVNDGLNVTLAGGAFDTATGTILNDDDPPTVSIADVSAPEGDDFTFTATLSAESRKEITVDWAAAAATGDTATADDFTAASNTLTFARGETSKTFTVSTTEDTADEPNETFTVTLSNPSNVTLDTAGCHGHRHHRERRRHHRAGPGHRDGGRRVAGADLRRGAGYGLGAGGDGLHGVGGRDGGVAGEHRPRGGERDDGDADPGGSGGVGRRGDGDLRGAGGQPGAGSWRSNGAAALTDQAVTNDTPATPTLSIADASGLESAGVEFTVTLSPASTDTVTVTWTATASDVNGDTAEAVDLAGTLTGSLSFAAGDTSETFTVATTGDTTDEHDETFTVTLSNPLGAPLSAGAASATGTIEDDDDPPTLTFSAPPVIEGDSGNTPVTVTATLSAASGKTVEFATGTTQGTATTAVDFVGTALLVELTPGQTSATRNFNIIGDILPEGDEYFTIGFLEVSENTVATVTLVNTQLDVTILDDDLPLPSGFSAAAGDGEAVLSWEAPAADADITAHQYRFKTDGNFPAAWTGVPNSAPGGANAAGYTVTGLTNGTEYTFQLRTVLQRTNAATGGFQADSQPLDSDPVTPAAADTTAPALDTATVNGTSLVLTYDEALDTGSVPASTAYTVSVGGTTVTLASASPVAVSGMTVTLTLAAAVAAGDVVTVSYAAPTTNPVQDAASNNAAALTNREVTNDTPATPTLSIADASGSEADGVEFTVTLSPASTDTVTVRWTATVSDVNGDTAEAADLAGTLTGSLSFTAGDTSKTFTVMTTDDAVDEENETFTVTLSNPSGAPLSAGAASATGTIEDNDDPPTVTFSEPSVTEGDSGNTPMTVTATLSAASEKPVTMVATIRGGTGGVGDSLTGGIGNIDFVEATEIPASITPGETSVTFEFQVIGDTLDENDEEINIFVNRISNTASSFDIFDGTILDDDDPPSVSIADASAPEGDDLTFTVTLSRESGKPITVNYATSTGAGDTATAGDFTAASDTLAFRANGLVEAAAGFFEFARGETSKTFTVSTTEDDVEEENETFTVTLSNPSNVTLATDGATAAGTIENDDDTTAPVLDTATVNGTTLVLTYGEALDTGSVPASTAYTVSVGGTTVTLAGASPVAVSGMTVTLTLAAAVASTDVVTVTYAVPTTNPVQDVAENAAAALTNRAVTNDTPATPTLSIADASGLGGGRGGVHRDAVARERQYGHRHLDSDRVRRERRHRRGGRLHGHADRFAELCGRRHLGDLHGGHDRRHHRRA